MADEMDKVIAPHIAAELIDTERELLGRIATGEYQPKSKLINHVLAALEHRALVQEGALELTQLGWAVFDLIRPKGSAPPPAPGGREGDNNG